MPDPLFPSEGDGDTADLDSTQPNPTPTTRIPVPPPPPPGTRGHVNMPPRQGRDRGRKEKRKNEDRPAVITTTETGEVAPVRRARRRQQDRSASGLYLPAWSVLAMLVVVFAAAGLIVFLVVYLGGGMPPGGDPKVVIITAVPSQTPIGGVTGGAQLVLPANSDGQPLPTFALEGPVLPTVAVSATPDVINIGKLVRVVNVGESGLNVRDEPGTGSSILFRAREGDTFLVIDGPEQIENFTWWNIRSSDDSAVIGWAVEFDGEQDVLTVAEQPQ